MLNHIKLYSTYVTHRGKPKHISELKYSSDKPVLMKCPTCGKEFERFFKVLAKSGNLECQHCIIARRSTEKTLLPGTKKNRLTFIRPSEDVEFGVFDCDCGAKEVSIRYSSFLRNATKSCGCLNEENLAKKREESYSKELNKLRGSGKYLRWRFRVMSRDLYTCQKCKVGGGDLVAHHILPFETAVDLRFTTGNGVTLCRECHDKYHKIHKNVTEDTFNEYLATPC